MIRVLPIVSLIASLAFSQWGWAQEENDPFAEPEPRKARPKDDPFAEPEPGKAKPAESLPLIDEGSVELPSLESLLEADTPIEESHPEGESSDKSSTGATIRATQRGTVTHEKDEQGFLKWPEGLQQGKQQAAVNQQPLLVKVGAAGCIWCAKLELEFQRPAVQRELAKWTLAYIDADTSLADANRLKVSGYPALRILNLHGEMVAQQDGYLPEKDLLKWLRENFSKATRLTDAVLVNDAPLTAALVAELIEHLQDRNPLERESAIRRLTSEPALSKEGVLESLLNGNLATRLAAWEIMQQWQAPVAALDPWQPQTFTPEREAELREWIKTDIQAALDKPEELSEADQEIAKAGIKALLAAEEVEKARTLRERLIRFGLPLLPLVREELALATTDQDQERLLALRYRLAADNGLVLNWPGGLERLASRDVSQRHQAAEELAARASQKDQTLLLELFSDPDPLVREISLRGLQQVGGVASLRTMVKLLYDPDPNVRAAVLKQLTEGQSPGLALQVVKYVKQEEDADLLVHAIRYLKSSSTEDARTCLVDLTAHESWQVRAEAAEALGAMIGRDNIDLLSTYNRLIELLDDKDSFVVSRAMEAIAHGKIPSRAVEKLAQTAEKHPELAIATVGILAQAELTSQAVPQLMRFIDHSQPPVRAAAIGALASVSPYDYSKEILKALEDQDSSVRVAAASSIFQISQNLHSSARDAGFAPRVAVAIPQIQTQEEPGFFDKVFSLFKGKSEAKPEPAEEELVLEEKEIQKNPPADPEKKNADKPAEENGADEPDKAVEAGEKKKEEKPTTDEAGLEAEGTEEGWIQRYRLGKKRPSWMKQAIEPLQKLLTAESADERFYAALALIPLSKDLQAVAVLKEAAGKDRERLMSAAKALSWLPWEQRLELFDFLVESKPSSQEIYVLGQAMTAIPDPRSAEPLWKLLGDENVNLEVAAMLRYVLEELYRGDNYEPSVMQQVTAEKILRKYAEQGKPVQKVLALDLMRSLVKDGSIAAALAKKQLEDKKFPAELQLEVFRVLLLSESEPVANQTAVKILEEEDTPFKGIAIRFLARGSDGIAHLDDSPLTMYQTGFVSSYSSRSNREMILIEAPKGLKLEMVQPLLQSKDEALAGSAGYLAATLGEKSGMDPLLAYWRNNENDDDIRKLVVRAISALNDPLQVPVLEEIYGKLDTYDAPEFYWTIRSMTGPEVLGLRKKIRGEVGMSRLR